MTITFSMTNTICLNMIVKNESRVILRLLESVVQVIDGYCICDTGSTDNTIELIEGFFADKGIPGKIIREPFRDFGYNRTFALQACADIPNMDYILLMDADMILTGSILASSNMEAFKMSLNKDCYHICQGSPDYYYKNVRIVRNYRGYSYWGVTHEYVSTPAGTSYDSIPLDVLFINDIGDGGAKLDKFERDIRLLTKGLEENPNNDRYTFYLANSLRDAGHTERAIETFRKRVEIGGWIEEVWQSHYNIGICYASLGQYEKAICAWVDAYQAHPKRIESLYEIVKYYREQGKNYAAFLYLVEAERSRKLWGASDDFLFLKKDIYDYKLDFEFSIIAYYIPNHGYDIVRHCMTVLSYPHLPEGTANRVFNNYKFYVKRLQRSGFNPQQLNILETATDSLDITKDAAFTKSTPSIALRGNYLLVNSRYVNYYINDEGNYINRSEITTKNAVAVIDISNPIWKVVQEFELKYDMSKDGYYVGLEDVRLYVSGSTIHYQANRGMPDSTMTVENGHIALDSESTKNVRWPIHQTRHTRVEKNWVICDESKIITHWGPQICLGEYKEDAFVETHKIAAPYVFKHLRGSTNAVVIKNELWFICHTVSYEDRRYYYHMVVVLDAETYAVKRYSPFFTFEGEKVEYTLGFVYFENTDQLVIGYSLYDKCAKYMQIGRETIENDMISFV